MISGRRTSRSSSSSALSRSNPSLVTGTCLVSIVFLRLRADSDQRSAVGVRHASSCLFNVATTMPVSHGPALLEADGRQLLHLKRRLDLDGDLPGEGNEADGRTG